MTAILDTGFLYATFAANDPHHNQVDGLLAELSDELLLPTVVLVELSYLLQARLGHKQMRQILNQLEQGPIPLMPLTRQDLRRVYALLEQYADMRLDFVDATIVALAERLNIKRILTVDKKDFQVIRPNHCAYFEILPD